MIAAKIYKQDGLYWGYEISGHADYSPHGTDIVCAAVSFLAITVENSLDMQIGKIESKAQSGYISCRLCGELSADEALKAQAVLKTLAIGLKRLKATYPEYIRLQLINIKH